MQYLCLVYQDEQKIIALSTEEHSALIAETHAYSEELRMSGHLLASSAIELMSTGAYVRVRDGQPSITDGPCAATHEQLGGYVLIDARDLNEAIRVAARMPPARFGGIDVRPVRSIRHP
jgi:hypothetical protein